MSFHRFAFSIFLLMIPANGGSFGHEAERSDQRADARELVETIYINP